MSFFHSLLSSGGEVYSEEYQAILDRATTLGYTHPSNAQKRLQNQLIVDLKAAGIWILLDTFYVFATDGDSNFATLNWKSPTQFRCGKVGNPTFTTNGGFTGNGTSSYLNTNWVPSTNGVNYTLNLSSLGLYSESSSCVIGARNGDSQRIFLNTFDGSSLLSYSINSLVSTLGNSAGAGFYNMNRTSSTSMRTYKNGSSLGVSSRTSGSIPSVSIFLLAQNNNGVADNFSAGQIRMFYSASDLTGKQSAFNNAWNAYNSSLVEEEVVDTVFLSDSFTGTEIDTNIWPLETAANGSTNSQDGVLRQATLGLGANSVVINSASVGSPRTWAQVTLVSKSQADLVAVFSCIVGSYTCRIVVNATTNEIRVSTLDGSSALVYDEQSTVNGIGTKMAIFVSGTNVTFYYWNEGSSTWMNIGTTQLIPDSDSRYVRLRLNDLNTGGTPIEIQWDDFILRNNVPDEFHSTLGYHIINGDQLFSAIDPFGAPLFNPTCVYKNGRTYFTWKRNQNSSDGQPIVGEYYEGKIRYTILSDVYTPILDYHDHPTLVVDADGYIWVFLEQHATTSPHTYRSTKPYNITKFTKIVEGVTARVDYPKTYVYPNGNFIQWLRTGALGEVGLGVRTSTDGVTWSSIQKVTEATSEQSAVDYRHYPYIPTNWVNNGEFNIVLFKRIGDAGTELYIRVWHLKTMDGVTYYNEQGTFSKDVVADGFITETELNDNCLIWHNPDGEVGQYTFIMNGIIHISKSVDSLYYYNNGWQLIEGALPYRGGFPMGSDFYNIYEDQSLYAVNATDDFITIKSKSGAVYKPNTLWQKTIPVNMDEIPSGQKFIVLHATQKNGDSDRVNSEVSNDIIAYEITKP